MTICAGCQSLWNEETRNLQVRFNSEGFALAAGKNTFVDLTGMRVVAHELGHALNGHVNDSSVARFSNETGAMRIENRVMKQHYMRIGQPGLAGERLMYESVNRANLPSGAVILR